MLAPGYRVIAHLSRGNRLDVYDAWSVERDCRVVLKTLRPDRASEAAARRALSQEGRLLRRLTHPHLVRAYDTVSADDGRPVVVLETLGGETLSHLVHRLRSVGRGLTLVEAAMLGLQLCSAVGYLHRQGFLHLDLKPSNIVADSGRAKLIDLSIARRPGRAPRGGGTFEYMAPEQARGGVLTAAADVWGIGAVVFDVLAGGPPFGYGTETDADGDTSASSTDDRSYPQLAGRAPSVTARRRVPRQLATIVDACLEPSATDRPTLPEVAETLSSISGYAPLGAAR
jgi:serine/threonine protein kinase